AGELHIGGIGVARGYLNQPDLSAERFIADPFSSDPQARLYKTGDVGRWLANGALEYLGRNDFQVKIRGLRIEIGEIEAALAKHPAVHEAVVTAREDVPGDKRLVAYYTQSAEHSVVDIETLRSHLQQQLPEYMVPAIYVLLDTMPLTPNGKLDRKALPAPDGDALISRGYEAPQGETETQIAVIWQDLLGIAQIGRHDNFFELGGHSLLAVSLTGRMRQLGLSADVRVLFSQPTLAALAAAVGGGTEIVVPANLITLDCPRITPELLPLADLNQVQIDHVVATVPGGVANVQDIYALAPLQAGILYHHLAAETGDPYVLQTHFAFADSERLNAFVQALQMVIDRHDILRTSVVWEGLDSPVQVVWRKAQLHLEGLELDPADGDIGAQLHSRFDPRHYRLDIGQAPLMRVAYAEDPLNQRIIAMLLFHHMALDHVALEVVKHEMQAWLAGEADSLAASVPVPYRNYVAQARLGVSLADHEAFFRDMLGDIDEPTLPFGLLDVQGEGRDIEEASLALAPQLNLRLRAQARQQGVSAASLVHLACAQVLGKVSNRQDVVFGTVLMGRMQSGEGAERALGMFINTLPLRVSVAGQGVRSGVKATHKRLTALLGHEHASLALAQRCSGVAAPAPLFSALLNYRHSGVGSVSDQAMQAWQGIAVLSGEERTNYPLTLNVDDLGDGFSLTALVVSSIGSQRVCGYMHTALENLVTALEQTPETSLQDLSILPAAEREQLLVAFNDTALDYPQQQTIHGMFEAQAERTPQALAVIHGEQRLTYRELNEQANRLAHALRKQGVQPDSRVGICVERSVEMVVGLLAILKAGGGYVPLDPAYPAERIAYMLQDSAPAAVLAQSATEALLADVSMPVINLDLINWQDESVQNPQVPGLTSAHLAYLIYTSGSTGLPKGVMIEHRNTVNFLTWAHTAFDASALEKTLFSTSLNFDLAVYECFAPLTSGGSIDVVKNVLELQHGEHDIGLINTVPSALKALLDVDGLPKSVHTVNVAGEALKRSLVESLFEKTGVQRLCNLYGPSETTTYSSWVAMDRKEGFAAHIGKPVGNTQFYLLDEQQQPVPLGVAGEIYIGGAGVARGYLNRDDLTAERFLKDPFSQQPAARMYRTGDLGRYLPDGNIEYLGRNDDQVKIRGFRIELGEIDARLAKHPAVHEAVVTAHEDIPGDKRLVAYYTLSAGQASVDIDSLRAWLQEQLPAYMIPAAYVLLNALPLTPNGKLDRKALPAPDADALIRRGYEAPQGEAEAQIAAIWEDLLGIAQVGRHDNFFELGGHSLLAVSLIGRMRQSGLSSDVRVLFSQPTLAALAAAVGGGTEVVVPANLIPEHCEHITPDLLPLADLTQAQIDQIVASVPGGVTNVQDIYPLAPLQEGILYHHLSAERGDPYLLQSLFAFDSKEYVEDFARALQFVIQRHDILRTALVWEGLDEPMQVVWRQALLMRESFDPDPQGGDVAAQLHERFDARHCRLDIRRAPMMRLVHVWDEPNQRWLAWLQFHHLIMDHTTLDVVRYEMQACLLGQGAQLGLTVPYRNYVAQVRLGMSQEEHEVFFRDMLSDVDEATLPFGLQEVQGDGHGIEEDCLAVDLELSRRLRAQARQLGVSAASLFHLSWAQLLSKASGRDDVVFGTVLLGRMQGGEGSDRALGVFINTLPLRVDLGEQAVRDGVKATHRRLTALLGHEHASLALAQRCSGVVAPAPLFSALLNYRHTSVAVSDEALTAWKGIQPLALGDEERTNYPLTLNVDDRGEDFLLTVQTVPLIGGARICAYMQQTLSNLVDALEQAPQTPLHAIAILPDSEREQLLEQWKQPGNTYTSETLIHLQFEARAAERPDAVALVFEEQTLSYGELNARANQVAHRLLAQGVQPDDRVAICVERGPAMIIGLLGILKSGAGYVPLDPAYPLERLAYVLDDSAPVALLSQQSVLQALPVTEVPFVSLDDADLQDESVCNPEVTGLTAASLAYVIYTSGSTGLPKGVMVEHRNVARLFSATEDWFGFNEQDVWALFHSFAFDFSVWEIWGALLHGGRLLIVPQLVSRSPEDFYNLLCSAGVTVLNQTPSAFRQLIATQGENGQAHSLRQVIFGGEALETAMLKPWYARSVNAATQLVNMYGITETTVHVTYYPLQAEDAQRVGASPIGRRIPDLQLYVLDDRSEPVPAGVVGELYVGGAGVARGYLNRETLTAERFLDNPFSDAPDARMYRTGDLGRWLADGSLEYLGRNDEQVKIRGFRIELGEIEARLGEYPDVQDAVVICREDVPGDKRLVAYVTAQQPESQLDIESLREHLQGALPEHMVPAAYVQLDELPLTANGKLDRKALPVPDRSAVASRGYEAPQGDTEMAIARIWQDLLQLEQVGRHDHFFELGGHSLLAVKLIERMRQINLVADVRVLFGQPTLSALAAAVGGKGEVTVPANLITAECERITPDMLPLAALSQDDIDRVVASVPGGLANVQDIYALAPLQEGILYHHLAATEGDPYLQYALFGFDSLERLHSFAQALQGVISRHDILRTAVLWERLDAPVQVVWRDATLGLDEHVLDPVDGDIAEQLLERLAPRHTRLDIRQAPMLRIGYAHDAQNDRWLGMLLFHHLVDDATSLRTLSGEIESYMLGQQASLPPSVPYRNYVAQAMLGVSREEHEAFFRDMLGDIDEPTLPFGLQDVQGDGRGIEEVRQPVDTELSRRLRLQARKLGVSSASLYHLVWARVLGAVSGKEDVVFGTVLLGRLQGGAGADRALGMFINTLPLRVTLDEQDVRSGLKATHARLSGLLAHEHASLVLAQRCSGVSASTPLFSALLNYRHIATEVNQQALDAWQGIESLRGEERTNYPLTLSVNDEGVGFSLTIQASACIDVQRVCAYVQTTLENVVSALEQSDKVPLAGLSVLSAAEREHLVHGLNATALDYPQQQTIHGMFEAQVERTPDALAVVHGEQRLTYRELNQQANRLAHALRKQGVQPDSRVGICVERSAQMVVGLLAILKAGGGYVPLDPAYPAERIAYMLQDSAPVAVLAQSATEAILADVSVQVINLDLGNWQDESVQNPQVPGLTSAHLAYLIYTSGSTGLPKGVMIEHRNTVNFLTWAHTAFDASVLEKTLFSTSLNFDLAVYECFAPLTSGGSIEVVKNVLELQHGEHDIGLINTVPSALKALLDVDGLPKSVHTVNVAGEALKRSLVESLFEKTGVQRLCNLYGPSETTTYSSWVAMDRKEGFAAHIGKPVGNTQFYLLDEQQQPMPLGVAGEIYIGGAGVARGYLNRDDLTAERFLKDPFSQQPAARMYRTGDLGRYLPDGNIEYLGRNDDQVKIRGFRIELGEIDARLAKHPAVHEAVVTAREDVPGDKRLVAYYTLSAGQASVDIDSLRAWLQEQLPAHMIPVAYVRLDAMPLTPNGKLDRKALPAPDADALIRRGYEAPQGETETLLAQIWSDLLSVERISRHDQFFELGGHSLLAMRLISQIRQQLGVELSLAALFAHPELSALALAIARAGCSILPDIVPVARDQVWPLSFGQQRLWFLAQMEGASAAYHMPVGLSLRGKLDRAAMQRALERIVARHEGLRTTFIQGDDEQPLQRISPADAGFNLQLHDLQGLVDSKEKLQALASEESLQGFNLEQGPLIRGRLIRMAEDHHVLLLTMHHIVSDGWSIGVLTRELAALYAAFSQGQDDPLAPLPLQYLDYAVWQRRWLSGDLLQQQSDYWQQTLADAPALLMLPTDRVRPAQQDYAGAMLPIVFDEDLTRGLKALSQRHGSTLFMTVMAAWAALLGRLSGQDDVVIGTPVANRTRSETEGLVGLFVNTLAIRVDLSDKPTAETLLARIKTNTLGAQDHQELPFEQVVEVIKPVRSLSHSPVFQAMLSWQDMGGGGFALGDLQLESLSAGHTLSKFDLSLDIGETQGQLLGSLEYATALFDESTIARYLGYLQRLLHAMVTDDRQVLEHVPLLDTVEHQHLLVGLNATEVPYPQDCTIHQLFEEKVQAQPDAIAVAFQAQRLSYAELNRQANRLAHHLIGLGIGPDDRVAICVERGVKMIVGLLGVLKAGGAYVPLDPAYPAERLAYMINDSQPAALLTQRGLQERLPALSMPLVLLDDDHCQGFTECDDNPVVPTLGVRNLAYVIYTSGSTGNPKGVMIEHRGLVNYSVDAARLFGLSQSDTVLQQNTLNFDLSVEEIFPALLAGATLAPSREIFGSEGTENHGIYPTVLHLTAAHWHTLVAEWHNQPQAAEQRLAEVRLINVTGDALSAQKLKLWDEVRPAHTRLINTYGPTEATVSCTAAYVSHDAAVGSEGSGNATIGKPMANTRIYLLDAHQQPVPYGVAGEIFIGGDGVARGYLNLEEVNAERFLADPFSNSPDARMYKTGDLARYMADGRIEYLGRNDFQVKVRGFRIELGEIESRLGSCKGVKEAVVIAREDNPGEKRLVAYVIAQPHAKLDAASLRAELAPQLAEYMLPSAFVLLDALPLTPNRKLDRKALPAPADNAFASREHVAPQGTSEKALAQIWQNLLNLEEVGRHDHFFELGGHSLLAMRMISQVRQRMGVELSLADIFAQPDLAALAQAVAHAAGSSQQPIVPVSRDQSLPLSFAQQRLWFLAQLDGGSAAYHIPAGLRLRGSLDQVALKRALDRIVARHEALRTTFVQAQDQDPLQCIAAADIGFSLQLQTLTGQADAEQQLLAIAAEEAEEGFDLLNGPLVRGRLVCLADDDHVLLVTMHHIVSDGWSAGVLTRELGALYAAFSEGAEDPLPALPVQYADYALWQRNWLSGDVLQQQRQYWQQTLAGAPALLTLPSDRPRPTQQDYSGQLLGLVLDADLTRGLKALSQRHGSSLFMTVMAAWAALLGRLAGQDDVVIGTPVANRMRAEVEDLIGFFVNTLAVRVDLSGTPSVQSLLQQVKQQTLAAQANQDLPFEQVVEVVRPQRSLSHSPIFQAMLSWQNSEASDLALGDMTLQGLAVAGHTAKFDLTLDVTEVGDQLIGTLEYATALFDESTVQRYTGYFQRLLEAMVADDRQLLEQVSLLDAVERQHLLVDLNATEEPYPQDCMIHQLFEEKVQAQPDAIAVVFEAQRLSYAELNRQANRLAHHLIGLGIGPDDRVAICVERGVEMMVGLLGVLKAGAAYVPLDPAYPAERLAYMIDDSQPAALLSQRDLQKRLPTLTLPLVLLDNDQRTTFTERDDNPVVETLGVRNLAYVIYTSGSTGNPKGVMIEHRGLVNYSVDAARLFALSATDTVLQQNTLNFDLSVEEIFPALLAGAILAPSRDIFGSDGTETHGISPTVLHLTAAHWHTLVAEWHKQPQVAAQRLQKVRLINVTGDALSAQKLKLWDEVRPAHTRLINTYGPTEATVSCTAAYVSHDAVAGSEGSGNATIGKPMANTRIYLLDAHQQPVPYGVAGEIFIGGDGVARGYLNLAEVNAERFLADPFSNSPDARMYKTGDLARYMADGRIEYLGRNDFQVKVRGFRIELGEIEARLGNCVGVKEGVVVAREDNPGDKRLVAYVVAQPQSQLTAAELRAELAPQLAEYMLPSAFVILDALPLTPNRKLDRNALPAPQAEAFASREHVEPQGETELALAQIWQDLLDLEQVGRHDQFFELGGHSLLAMRLISQVRLHLSVELSLADIFAQPELAAMARILAEAQGSIQPPIVPVPRDQALPLSFSQQRLWFLAQLEGGSAAYHIPAGLRLRGTLDNPALERALDRIVARHEVLRTTFVQEQDQDLVQHIAPANIGFSLQLQVLNEQANAEEQLLAITVEEANEGFDLLNGPLVRGRLVRMAEDDHVLLVTMHHIVSDGWSADVLTRELGVLYAAFSVGAEDPLPALPVQYADYAVWQRNWLSGDVLHQQRQYWQQTLGGAPALLTLPTDRPRPAQQDYSGNIRGLVLDAELTRGLKTLGQRHGGTLFMTVMVAWASLLGRLAGQDDVVIGTPVANRLRAEVEDLIGFFVNTLAIRVDLSGAPSVGALMQQVKRQTLAAQTHQDLPFEQVVEVVRPQRSLSHSPIFQAMLSWQNNETSDLSLGNMSLQGVAVNDHTAKFDLVLDMTEVGDQLVGTLEYATALFDESTMVRYLGYFQRLLEAMVDNEDCILEHVPLVDAVERQHLVTGLNATARAYPQGQLMHRLFEAQAASRPQAIAAHQGEQTLTYAELDSRANALAQHLRLNGAGPGTRVAILLDRSVELLTSMLAILKCGAAYLALDRLAPEERLRFMLEDSEAIMLLSRSELAAPEITPRLDLDTFELSAVNQGPVALADDVSGETPACIIYTSGSTGMPKGVIVTHNGIVRLVRDNYDFRSDDRVAFSSNPAFDASSPEIWGALLNGGQSIIVEPSVLLEPTAFAALLKRHAVTVMFSSTALFNLYAGLIPEALAGLRMLECGGERADPASFRRVREHSSQVRLFNGYGPTEGTTCATRYEVFDVEPGTLSLPIGKPNANVRIYLLDACGEPVPTGSVGEICIGGVGVALGYLNRPELTTERFRDDPFSQQKGARLYRTGDLARWLPDGNLEYLARNDGQVKIRGFRVEPGEVESTLHECDGVRNSVVVAREDSPGDTRLVAYYTVHAGVEAPEPQALRAQLSAGLPEYMVPSVLICLPDLPLTLNGKVDVQALPAPTANQFASLASEAPAGELEVRLAKAWTEVLEVQQVGRHDNFFSLGGHSLMAVRLVSQLVQSGLSVSLADVFQHASVAALASLLVSRAKEVAPQLHEQLVPVRTSGSQRPLFLVHEFTGLDVHFPALAVHIDSDIPVYGLSGIPLGQEQLLTMECLATRLLGAMRSVQPHGPYRLAGWSFGGLLAYEIAIQLEGMDEEVEFIGLLDTYMPRLVDKGRERWDLQTAHSQHLLEHCEQFWKARGECTQALEALERVRANQKALDFAGLLQHCREEGALPPELDIYTNEDLRHYLDREVAHGHAQANYTVYPNSVPLHLFTAIEWEPDSQRHSGYLGWDSVLPVSQLRSIRVAGDHLSMMKAPHIEGLGQAISRVLADLPDRAQVADSAHRPLLTIQGGRRDRTPVFCVPGAGDSVTGFIGLANALGPDWPLHGLQPRGLDGRTVPYSLVETAAEAYLQSIDSIQPKGPVHLLGHSFGGWVAFEMAARLTARGREVASLTLIDSESPGGNGVVGKPYTAIAVLERLIETMELAAGKSLGIDRAAFSVQDDIGHMRLLHAGMVRAGMLPQRSSADAMRGPARAFGTALRTRYQPSQIYTGPVRLVLADDPVLDAAGNQREQQAMVTGWRQCAPDLTVWRGPGNHFTILKAQHVQHLANWWLPRQ
ncbi:syringopeptin non-ribosomal peptide synthetase SypC, partial [Pseudomonas viridiflava]|nr:syringopeptin non-ribosomal peptide synthetase SypC [Pseudomonas viridiflava]